MDKCKISLPNENATTNLGFLFAKVSVNSLVTVHLNGDLGAGKTTFSRGFLRAMGYMGLVKSPTYTFIETYRLSDRLIYHFDFYRIYSSGELEFIGARDCLSEKAIHLVEWASKGENTLPSPDLVVNFFYKKDGLRREAVISAHSALGTVLFRKLSKYTSDIDIVRKVYFK